MPTSPPRHLATSPWPWRLLLVALGLTTAVLAALLASTALIPQSSPLRRTPTLALPAAQAEPASRSGSAPTTGAREPTTTSILGAPAADPVPPDLSTVTTISPSVMAQAQARVEATSITVGGSTVSGTTVQPVVAAPTTTSISSTTTEATTTTVPTTTAAPTTTLASTTTTEPPTTDAEPTTTTAG